MSSSSQKTVHFNEDQAEWKTRGRKHLLVKREYLDLREEQHLSSYGFWTLRKVVSTDLAGRLSHATSYVAYASNVGGETSIWIWEPTSTRTISELTLPPCPVSLAPWCRESPPPVVMMVTMANSLCCPSLSPLPGRCRSCIMVCFPAELVHRLRILLNPDFTMWWHLFVFPRLWFADLKWTEETVLSPSLLMRKLTFKRSCSFTRVTQLFHCRRTAQNRVWLFRILCFPTISTCCLPEIILLILFSFSYT